MQLMEAFHPTAGLNYLGLYNDFKELDLDDVVDVSALPVEFLASIQRIGTDVAHRIQVYCEDKLLYPLRYLLSNRTMSVDESSSGDGEDVLHPSLFIGEEKRESISKWVDACEEVEEPKERAETIVGTDDEEDDGDVVSRVSCEV